MGSRRRETRLLAAIAAILALASVGAA